MEPRNEAQLLPRKQRQGCCFKCFNIQVWEMPPTRSAIDLEQEDSLDVQEVTASEAKRTGISGHTGLKAA